MKRIGMLAATLLGWSLVAGCQGPVDRAAHEKLLKEIGTATVTVYPVFVRGEPRNFNDIEATRLGEYLAAEKLAVVTISPDRIDLPGEWSFNQSRMFRDSVEAMRVHLEQRPPSSDYALLAEYLMTTSPEGEELAVGVHCYVMTRGGKLALGVGLNSHDRRFAEAQPRTAGECTDLLMRVIEDELCRK